MKLKLLRNERAGIFPKPGDDEVNMIFCANHRVDNFTKSLPKKVQKRIEPGWFEKEELLSKGMFSLTVDSLFGKQSSLNSHFPYVSTSEMDLDEDLVNMMAHQASYSLKTGLELLKYNADALEN